MNNSRVNNCNNRNTRPALPCCDETHETYPANACRGYPKVTSARDMVLAMAYVPWQSFGNIFEPDKALCMGTVFPELVKPFTDCKGGRCL